TDQVAHAGACVARTSSAARTTLRIDVTSRRIIVRARPMAKSARMRTRIRPIASSEITPRALYLNRREFLQSSLGAAAVFAGAVDARPMRRRMLTTTPPPSPRQTITTFNNSYEFGSDKADPAKNSKAFKPKPWSVAIEGLCNKPGTYTLEDIVKPHPLEERV